MNARLNPSSMVGFIRRCLFLQLFVWLAFTLPVLGQITEEQRAEAIRSSARAAQQEKTPELAEVSKLVIQQTNAFRQEQGLAEVAANPQLAEAAQYFAQFMAKTNQYGHTADGKHPWERAKNHGYDYCLVSENIAYQYHSLGFETKELADRFFQGWKHSPGHRKNMLEPASTETGVAVAQSPDTGYFYAVQMFGRPQSQSIKFEIENHSASTVHYQLGTDTYPLPPSYTRTHQQCRPLPLNFRWPEGAKGAVQTVQPKDGDRFVITEEAGQWQVKQE